MKRLLPVIFALLISVDGLRSQQPLAGLIEGRIVDQKGAPIASVSLTATNIDSVDPESHRRTTAADRKGIYQFVDVPMGRYSIVFRKNGYRDYQIAEVTVRGGETVRLPDIRMSLTERR